MALKQSGIRDIGHKALAAARIGDEQDKVAAIAICCRDQARLFTIRLWSIARMRDRARVSRSALGIEGERVLAERLWRGNAPAIARIEADCTLHGQQVEPPLPVRAARQEPGRAAAGIAGVVHNGEVSLFTQARLRTALIGAHEAVHLSARDDVVSHNRAGLSVYRSRSDDASWAAMAAR